MRQDGPTWQSGTLTAMWDSVRPSPGCSPKKLQGAIIRYGTEADRRCRQTVVQKSELVLDGRVTAG